MVKIMRIDETFACRTFSLLEKKTEFSLRPTFIAKFLTLPRQISQFRGHFENRLEKNEKNRIDWFTFTEKMRPIGEGPKFALSVLTRTASFKRSQMH